MKQSEVTELAESEFSDSFVSDHNEGPDYIIPANNHRTWEADGSVNLWLKNDKFKPESVVSLFHKTVTDFPNNTAMTVKRNGQLVKWTYSQYLNQVKIVAKGFIKLGLLPFHSVAILGFNAPEWFMSCLGAIFAGGFSAGIYTTNSPDACFHILNDSAADIFVVENEDYVEKISPILSKLPNLKAIIQFSGTVKRPQVLSWDDLLIIGQSLPDYILDARIQSLAINQCCCLIYTSGTTGPPKGVMISHDNIIYQIKYTGQNSIKGIRGQMEFVSYLPLSHIAALAGDLFLSIHCAACVNFAQPSALKGSLIETLKEVKPTNFHAVPRVYEKIYDKLQQAELQMSFIKKTVFNFAKKQASAHNSIENRVTRNTSFFFTICKKLILDKLKKFLGFERFHSVLCGGAPISTQIEQYFLQLNIPIVVGYGLSETTGVIICNDLDNPIPGTAGNINIYSENQFKINEPDEKGCGEIYIRSRDIFMGYLMQQKATEEAIDNDRWFHTGDVGIIDEFGDLRITGRVKELIITSGGENIPPLVIEDAIKRLLPVVSNCMVVGERKNYLSILLTLKVDVDMETMLPTETLSPLALNWCEMNGSKCKTLKQLIETNDSNVMQAIQKGIDQYNTKEAISNAQRIQKWTILPMDFCIPNGELGPTAKMKRATIMEKYKDIVDAMYTTT